MESVSTFGPRRHFLVILLVVLTVSSVSHAQGCWNASTVGTSMREDLTETFGTAATTLDECLAECFNRPTTCAGIDWQPNPPAGTTHCTLGKEPNDLGLNVVPTMTGVIHYHIDRTVTCPTTTGSAPTTGSSTTASTLAGGDITSSPPTTTSTVAMPSVELEERRPLVIILLAMLVPLVLGVTCCGIWMFYGGGRRRRRIRSETSTAEGNVGQRPAVPPSGLNSSPWFTPYSYYGPAGRPKF